MVVNALRCLGKRVSERSVSKLAGTTEKGWTDEFGIQNSLTTLRFSYEGHAGQNRNVAWDWLVDQVSQGRPVIITVQNAAHWVCVVGMVGPRVILVDSSNTKNNKLENGIHIYGKVEFLKRWRTAQNGEYFGLGVHR